MSTAFSERPARLSFPAKVRLAVRVWGSFVRVRSGLNRTPLPVLARNLARTDGDRPPQSPWLLGYAVNRALRIGPFHPRCLISALVLYRLLREQGDEPELVIGLLPAAPDQRAHAWIELDGRDVGPPPGRGRHAPLARFSAEG